MTDAAQAWWYSLDDETRDRYEVQQDALYDAYLEGHLDLDFE